MPPPSLPTDPGSNANADNLALRSAIEQLKDQVRDQATLARENFQTMRHEFSDIRHELRQLRSGQERLEELLTSLVNTPSIPHSQQFQTSGRNPANVTSNDGSGREEGNTSSVPMRDDESRSTTPTGKLGTSKSGLHPLHKPRKRPAVYDSSDLDGGDSGKEDKSFPRPGRLEAKTPSAPMVSSKRPKISSVMIEDLSGGSDTDDENQGPSALSGPLTLTPGHEHSPIPELPNIEQDSETDIVVTAMIRGNEKPYAELPWEVRRDVRYMISAYCTVEDWRWTGNCLLCRSKYKKCVRAVGDTEGWFACRQSSNARLPCVKICGASKFTVLPLLEHLRMDHDPLDRAHWVDGRKSRWTSNALWQL